MTDVFVAGPIDFQDLQTVVDYRLRIRDLLRERGFTPVDQYSEALEQLEAVDFADDDPLAAIDIEQLPDEPYLEAVSAAVAETSVETVVESPSVVPRHTPDATVEALVERDLELVESADAFLAYLPDPSCGTMAELLHARENDLRTVVVSDPAPHFVRYYADEVHPTVEDAVESLASAFDAPASSEA